MYTFHNEILQIKENIITFRNKNIFKISNFSKKKIIINLKLLSNLNRELIALHTHTRMYRS